MPLPQQVINQLSRETPGSTPGWSSGVLLFSSAVFIVALVIYFGIAVIYQPVLNNKIKSIQSQITTLSQSISSDDQANLVTFYSQITNLQSLLKRHVFFSQFFSWFEKNTEANVYYSQFSFGSGNQITITGNAPTEADINEQIAIFEASPEVQKVVVTTVGSVGTNVYQFSATLLVNPAIVTANATSTS